MFNFVDNLEVRLCPLLPDILEKNAVLEAARTAPARCDTASIEMKNSVEYWCRQTDGILPSYSEETRPSAILPTTNITGPGKCSNP